MIPRKWKGDYYLYFLKGLYIFECMFTQKVAKLLIGKVEFIVKLIKIYCSRNILIDEFKMLLSICSVLLLSNKISILFQNTSARLSKQHLRNHEWLVLVAIRQRKTQIIISRYWKRHFDGHATRSEIAVFVWESDGKFWTIYKSQS